MANAIVLRNFDIEIKLLLLYILRNINLLILIMTELFKDGPHKTSSETI